MSEADVLDHELVHAAAQINGEAIRDGSINNTYSTGGMSSNKETMPKEEAATMGIIPRISLKNIKYTSENSLRYEQYKTRRLNYNLK